jgi:uncharacterized membrane protein
MRRVLTPFIPVRNVMHQPYTESDFIRDHTALALNYPRIYFVLGSLFRDAGVGAEIPSRSAATPENVSAELSVDESITCAPLALLAILLCQQSASSRPKFGPKFA